MTVAVSRRVDLAALLAAVLAVVMAIVYVRVMDSQDDDPLAWVLLILLAAAVLTGYGSWRQAPRRKAILTVAAVGLLALGLLAIFTIGAPILVAGALALWAAQRP
jgi:drug/metabolite transporter (DMT)-like permease